MATYYKRDSGTNWDSSSSWSTVAYNDATNTGTYPQAGDTAYLVNGSASCTINVASACAAVDCTGYTNTLTMSNTMTTTGNVTFSSGMTFTPNTNTWELGTNGVTLTTNGKQFYKLKLNGPTGTLTLSGDCTCTNELNAGAGNGQTCTFTGGDFYAAGLYSSANSDLRSTTRKIVLNGGTWYREGYNSERVGCSVDLAGNVTISGQVKFHAIGQDHTELKYVSGTITTTGSTVWVYANGEDAGGQVTITAPSASMHFNNLLFSSDFSPNFVITNSMTCDGTLEVVSGKNISFSTGDITCNGLTMNTNSSISNGTIRTITMKSGTWQGSGRVDTNLTLDGNITVSGSVYYGKGTLLYSSGTITTTSSTLWFGGENNVTINTNGMTWNNITSEAMDGRTITLGSALQAASINLTGSGVTHNILACSTYGVTLTGNWTNPKGTTGRTGNNTFTFNGTSVLDGNTDFYNMTINAGKTVTFDDADTFTVTGTFTADGTSGSQITMNTDNVGTTVDFDVTGTVGTVNYVNATDIDSAGGNQITTTGGSITNTVNWVLSGGATGPANLKSYNTNLKANVKSINTNLIANVKSLNTNI